MNRPTIPAPTPQLPFGGGDSECPMPGTNAKPTWVRTAEGWTRSVWAFECKPGLAIQATPWRAEPRGKLVWHLALLHLASGLTVVSMRAGNTTTIELSTKNIRELTRFADALPACDWLAEQPEVDAPAVIALIAKHFPATPMWRGWRFRRAVDVPECKWHSSERAALAWASAYGGWHAVEHWTVPPARWQHHTLSGSFELHSVASGDLPEGCAGVRWSAHGEAREVKRGTPAAARKLPVLEGADALSTVVDLFGWVKESRQRRLPTGEYDQLAEAALAQGILRRVESDGAVWWVPSVPAMLARARQRVMKSEDFTNPFTADVLRAWRASRKDGRQRASYADGPPLEARRFALFCDLLYCLRRDREARASGKLPLELYNSRYAGGMRKVLSYEAGVAVVEINHALGMMWLTMRTTPVVMWAPDSTLAALRGRDGTYSYSTIEEHRARDWAENHAARMREGTCS